MGEQDFAIGDLSKAISLDQKNAVAYLFRGLAREKKGELQRSLEDFERCLELNAFKADAKSAIQRIQAALSATSSVDKGIAVNEEAPTVSLSRKPKQSAQLVFSKVEADLDRDRLPQHTVEIGDGVSVVSNNANKQPLAPYIGWPANANELIDLFLLLTPGVLAILYGFAIWGMMRSQRARARA